MIHVKRMFLYTVLVLAGIHQAVAETGADPSNAWELPPVVLEGLDGQQHALTEWKGRMILLNFWASWCGPCQYEIPDLVRFQNQYRDRGLQVIGIGIDEARPLRNVSRSLGINYPVLVVPRGAGGRMLSHWGNPQQVVPYSVLIGADGQILLRHRGVVNDEVFADFILPELPPVTAALDAGIKLPGDQLAPPSR